MGKRSTTTVGAVALAAGTLMLAGPAVAAERTFGDPRDDVRHGVDIETVKVVNEKNVRVVVHHEDLVRSYESGAGMTAWVDTDPGNEGPEFAFAAGLFEGTDYVLVRTDGWKLRHGAVPLRCSYEMNLDYAEDVTRFRMSRACLDRPDRVRVAVRAAGQQKDGDHVRDWLGRPREFTARVGRG